MTSSIGMHTLEALTTNLVVQGVAMVTRLMMNGPLSVAAVSNYGPQGIINNCSMHGTTTSHCHALYQTGA